MTFALSLSALHTRPLLRYGLLLAGIVGISAAVVLSVRRGPVAFPWHTAGGSGTGEDPYRIATCEQFQHIGNVPGAAYALTQDIDCSPVSAEGLGFLPIGDLGGFSGALDGQSRTVRGIVIRQQELDDVGVFRMLSPGARIEHLVLEVDVTGRESVGGLAGLTRSGALVTDVTVRGRVQGQRSVGALTGINEGTLRDVRSEATVEGEDAVGGIVGYNTEHGRIEGASVSGDVHGGSNVGGIAGIHRGATIDGCTVSGSVRGRENVGGIVGWMIGGEQEASAITHCAQHGERAKDLLPPVGKQGIAAVSQAQ